MTSQAYLDQNQGPLYYGVFCPFLGLSTIVVALRFYCRMRYLKSLQSSDYLIAIAVITNCAMSAMIHEQIQTGMGRHIEYVKSVPPLLGKNLKFGYIENISYQVSLVVFKSAILAQYYTIAGSRTQSRVVIISLLFVVIFGIFVTISAVVQCVPVRAAYDPGLFPQGCWNMKTMNLVTSVINTVVDVVIFILPLPVLAKLPLERRKKLTFLATYFFGSLSIVASTLRISGMLLWDGRGDFTYGSARIPIYDSIEINTGIICACVPLLRPLIRAVSKNGICKFPSRSVQVRNQSIPEGVGNATQLEAGQHVLGDELGCDKATVSHV